MIVRRALMLAALAAVTAAPARSADDGGVRSVFALGAGNRALALGGAYAALADDASAALWNPGGLGLAPQGQIQLSQANVSELEMRETFLGWVVPDWRWGVASLTLRHFGTDGIDARDERNLPLGDDAGASESEVGLAYARRLGPAWSLGGFVKLRRQQVAGASGNAVGADVGVQVLPGVALGLEPTWARRLRVGLVLHNAIEPAIRLDRERVPDPSGYRFGVAYEHPAFFLGGVVATVDVDKTRGLSAHPHAGIELRVHPMLALRTGLDGGGLTAGAGVRWGRAELDYAFQDDALGASQRAGVTVRFGAMVDEAEAAAQRLDEQRLEERLAARDRERQVERIAGMLARAEDARRQRAYDDALGILATLRSLEADRPEAVALERAILRDKAAALEAAGDLAAAAVAYRRALAAAPGDTALTAALERCRTESDRRTRRSAEIRAQFAAALDAFSVDDLPKARSGFAAILASNPGDTEAAAMLRRVERSITRRVESGIRQAEMLIESGALREAGGVLAAVRALDPRAPGLAWAESKLAQRQPSPETARPSRPAPPPATADAPARLTPQRQRELADAYRRGRMAFEAGRTDEALRHWELVWSIQPGYQRVDEYLKREYQARGMERFAAGRLDEAVALWNRALRIDPKDERTLGYLARAHEQAARAREIGGQE